MGEPYGLWLLAGLCETWVSHVRGVKVYSPTCCTISLSLWHNFIVKSKFRVGSNTVECWRWEGPIQNSPNQAHLSISVSMALALLLAMHYSFSLAGVSVIWISLQFTTHLQELPQISQLRDLQFLHYNIPLATVHWYASTAIKSSVSWKDSPSVLDAMGLEKCITHFQHQFHWP